MMPLLLRTLKILFLLFVFGGGARAQQVASIPAAVSVSDQTTYEVLFTATITSPNVLAAASGGTVTSSDNTGFTVFADYGIAHVASPIFCYAASSSSCPTVNPYNNSIQLINNNAIHTIITNHSLTFSFNSIASLLSLSNPFSFKINDVVGIEIHSNSTDTFNLSLPSNATFTFNSANSNNNSNGGNCTVNCSAIPEPASMALLAPMLFGLSRLVRRRAH